MRKERRRALLQDPLGDWPVDPEQPRFVGSDQPAGDEAVEGSLPRRAGRRRA